MAEAFTQFCAASTFLAAAMSAGAAQASTFGFTSTDAQFAGADTFTIGGQSITAEAFSMSEISGNISSATLGEYSGSCCGLGVTDRNESGVSPGHTVSNETSQTDFVLFKLPSNSYATQILLNGGWGGGTNADVFIGTGVGSGVDKGQTLSMSSMSGMSFNSLLTNWGFTQLDGNGKQSGDDFVGTDNSNTINLSGTTPDQYLIVEASTSDGWGTWNDPDYFKIGAITLASTAVPEPASFAVLGAGLAGLALLRRRRVVA